MKKRTLKRVLILGISFLSLAFLFTSCEIAKQFIDSPGGSEFTITIEGTVTDESGQIGSPDIYVGLMDYVPALPITSVSWADIEGNPYTHTYGYGISFFIKNVIPGRYFIIAFLDTDGNGEYNTGEPIGVYPINQVGNPDLKYFGFNYNEAAVTIYEAGTVNRAPTPPSNPNPPLAATDVSATPTLTWTPSTDQDGDEVKYNIYLDTDEDPVTKVAENLTDMSYSTDILTASTQYYWKVVAKDGRGGVTNGDVWYFTTSDTAIPQVATPTFSPDTGIYTSEQTVSISTSTSGATIRYTTDGSDPTSLYGTVYSIPVSISASTTLKAIAYKTGWNDSEVTSATYTLEVESPAFSPPQGTYTAAQSVALSSGTLGAEIRYTTDGSEPTSVYGAVYTTSVNISSTTTLKAVAYKLDWNDSGVVSAVYTINITGTVSTPTFTPGGGTYSSAQSVTISTTTPGAAIRYTTDGSTPTSLTGTLYSDPVSISASTTLKAIAYMDSWNDSEIATAVYTFKVVTPAFNPGAGTYTNTQAVTISTTTSEAAIKYTTDGSIPTSSTGTQYSAPVSISSTTTLKAIAYKTDWTDSSIRSGIYTIEYLFSRIWGKYGTDKGQFRNPFGIAVGPKEYVYVSDSVNNRVQKFTPSGVYNTYWGSYGPDKGQFSTPKGIAVDPDTGYVYIADSGNHRVQKFTPSGVYNTLWGSKGTGKGQFITPTGIAVDPDTGYVYIADSGNHRIQVFKEKGEFIRTWGSQGAGKGQFDDPTGVAVNPGDGYVYVADSRNHRIQVFDLAGNYVSYWGSKGSKYGQFNQPMGIAFISGFVYVADTNNNRIQKFDERGRFVTAWGIKGEGKGEFRNPYGVAVDSSGNVYVSEYGNHRVQKFIPAE